MGEDNQHELSATKLQSLQRSVSPILGYSGTHSLVTPGTVRNMICGFMQKEDLNSMSKPCTQFYNEVPKLHFDRCVHIIEPVLSKAQPVTFGDAVTSINHHGALWNPRARPLATEECIKTVAPISVWPWQYMSATETISNLLCSVDSIRTIRDLSVIFGITRHNLLYFGEKHGPNPFGNHLHEAGTSHAYFGERP